MQYWFHHRDALSVPLEDPDIGTDKAGFFVVCYPLSYTVQAWQKNDRQAILSAVLTLLHPYATTNDRANNAPTTPKPTPDYKEDVDGWGRLMAATNQQSNWSSGIGEGRMCD
jgi:hypothetical protein